MKKIVIINTITIFLSMFLFSNIYKWLPNNLTAIFFPVNESLFEHLKLMYIVEITISSVIYFIFKKKKSFNNYYLNLLLSTIFTISIFFLIYIPFYKRLGENLFITMSLYLIILIIGQYLFYLGLTKFKKIPFSNTISLFLIIIIMISLAYLTYNPFKTEFFFDTIEEIYGIPKN